MSKYITVSISQGSSLGPYTIYYNVINSLNVAAIYNGVNIPTTPANSVTFAQLTSPTPFIVVVPDTATQIILVDNVSPCPPIIQIIPVPTLTPTLTPTPTRLVGTRLTLQWVVRPQVPNNLQIATVPIINSIYPYSYTYSTLIRSGNTLNSPTYSFLPPTLVTNNNVVVSRTVDIPTFITPIDSNSFGISGAWTYPSGTVSNFTLKINLYINGLLKTTTTVNQGWTTSQLNSTGFAQLLTGSIFTGPVVLNNFDVILIEYTV